MPEPGLVTAACRELGLLPCRVTVIGCSDSVIAAALAADAHAIRVPEPPQPDGRPCAPCAPTACRSVAGPEEAADLLLRH
ncbi:hypothetical protein ACIRRH_43005 [Kitasatospora sp. NPDC101235]|uniref:hypothetical protein n=1 Tax=Kitasatospora sp. NPDC101235 TaxID=3364101 RepID=UPI00380577A9